MTADAATIAAVRSGGGGALTCRGLHPVNAADLATDHAAVKYRRRRIARAVATAVVGRRRRFSRTIVARSGRWRWIRDGRIGGAGVVFAVDLGSRARGVVVRGIVATGIRRRV